MIAVGKQENELRPFVRYLQEKHAAGENAPFFEAERIFSGVVTTPDAILYLFPSSDMALRLLSKFAPGIRILSDDSPFLLCVLSYKVSSNESSPR